MPLKEESARALAQAVRENLEEGLTPGDALAGSEDNPCCESCSNLFQAMRTVEDELELKAWDETPFTDRVSKNPKTMEEDERRILREKKIRT